MPAIANMTVKSGHPQSMSLRNARREMLPLGQSNRHNVHLQLILRTHSNHGCRGNLNAGAERGGGREVSKQPRQQVRSLMLPPRLGWPSHRRGLQMRMNMRLVIAISHRTPPALSTRESQVDLPMTGGGNGRADERADGWPVHNRPRHGAFTFIPRWRPVSGRGRESTQQDSLSLR